MNRAEAALPPSAPGRPVSAVRRKIHYTVRVIKKSPAAYHAVRDFFVYLSGLRRTHMLREQRRVAPPPPAVQELYSRAFTIREQHLQGVIFSDPCPSSSFSSCTRQRRTGCLRGPEE